MLTPDYHKIYKLKPVYNINKDKLKDKYFKLSKKYHPDIIAHKYKSIVDGYNVLGNDFTRAVYMYKGDLAKLEPVFLNEILELEAEIDDCGQERLNVILKYIEGCVKECKERYYDGVAIGKWRYYDRLINKIKDKVKMF